MLVLNAKVYIKFLNIFKSLSMVIWNYHVNVMVYNTEKNYSTVVVQLNYVWLPFCYQSNH